MFEEELSGGNTSVVVRVGDTVRRPVGPWTPAVYDLLNHLAAVGFRGAPRVRGIDELNREVLEFVSGEVGTLSPADPLPWWFRGADGCWSIGRLSAAMKFCPEAATELPAGGHEGCPVAVTGSARHDVVCLTGSHG